MKWCLLVMLTWSVQRKMLQKLWNLYFMWNIYLNRFHCRFFYISTLNVSVFDWLRMSWTHFMLWLRHKSESCEAVEPVKSKTTRFTASRTVFITTNAKTCFLKFHRHKRVAEVWEWRHVAESSFNLPVVAFSF